MKTPIVFVSHSGTHEIGPLLRLLSNEKAKVAESFDSPPAENLATRIQSLIHGADAMIAVLGSGPGTENVFYEIGYASALRKPILILLRPGLTIPEFAAGARFVVADIMDSEVLGLGVKTFLRGLTKRGSSRNKPTASKANKKSDKVLIQALVHRVVEQRSSISPREAERLVADLLRAAAVTEIEEQTASRDHGVDFAVWSDALQSSLGNPILIEVKAGNLDHGRLQTAYERLVSQVLGSGARFGILLYLDHSGKRFKRPNKWIPSVLVLDVEDLANELLSKSFPNALMERRNRLVHGLPE